MMKQELLNKLYSNSEYENISISDFVTLAHFYNIEFECCVETPIYNYKIIEDVCSELNKLYKEMTCKNLYSNKLYYKELNDVFNEIKAVVIFK